MFGEGRMVVPTCSLVRLTAFSRDIYLSPILVLICLFYRKKLFLRQNKRNYLLGNYNGNQLIPYIRKLTIQCLLMSQGWEYMKGEQDLSRQSVSAHLWKENSAKLKLVMSRSKT